MPNYYHTSSGEKVSQATIDARRSKTYREMYEGFPHPSCRGCDARSQGSAHIVPQKRCKDLGKAEYCWTPLNILPACHRCNGVIESYKSDEFKTLMCYEWVMEVTRQIDPERYSKMI